MKCITIQHKHVLNTINLNGEYKASYDKVSENLILPYQFMQEKLHWKTTPIFLVPVGYYVEVSGARFHKDAVAIELDIPDEFIAIQKYYNWTDFIYFVEQPDEFYHQQYSNVWDWGATILDNKNKLSEMLEQKVPVQITAEILRKEWITDILYDLDSIQIRHDGSGGSEILKDLNFYKNKEYLRQNDIDYESILL